MELNQEVDGPAYISVVFKEPAATSRPAAVSRPMSSRLMAIAEQEGAYRILQTANLEGDTGLFTDAQSALALFGHFLLP